MRFKIPSERQRKGVYEKSNQSIKKRKNAVILAHYYVPAEVQEIADFVGDSFYLAKTAKQCNADIIVFAAFSSWEKVPKY